jgi:hydroxymethylpyrimidine kinase/phosphomethylpyrimidine kinase/thiamine-phosphate diphosphorylase
MNPTVWTFTTHAQDIQQGLQQAGGSPAPALLCLNSGEAATLLNLSALDSREAVSQAAARLRAALGMAVVITGKEGDFADTPQASGWLTSPPETRQGQVHPDTDTVFADAASQALARGFVAMEAIVIAAMARNDALRQHAT